MTELQSQLSDLYKQQSRVEIAAQRHGVMLRAARFHIAQEVVLLHTLEQYQARHLRLRGK